MNKKKHGGGIIKGKFYLKGKKAWVGPERRAERAVCKTRGMVLKERR